mmetsp:Transcript_10014/g.16003  ORF Transcript_10014/g.16003 Transcript_10014/m.16003 type:complete len:175 (-) Transcript_10014:76-600(-)
MPKTPTAKVGKPGQEPGPCAACRAVAHRLQTTLHAAYRTHTEGDNDAVAMMMDRQEELPRASHRAAMNGVCEDNVYWDRYKSYKLEAGGSVLAGPGLEWSPSDHPEDAVEPGSHARHLGDACRAALITAAAGDGDGIYRAFWQGRRAPGSRKWFLQDALCGQSGQPCAKRHDEL